MTPLAGLIAAIIAGWFVRDPRRAVVAVIPAFLAVLAIQTTGIGPHHRRRARGTAGQAGRGRRAVIVAAALTPAAGVFDILQAVWAAPVRQHSSQGSPPVYGFAGMGLLAVLLVVLSALLLRRRRVARRQLRAGARPSAVPAGGRR